MEKHILELEKRGYSGDIPLEDLALERAIEETYESNGKRWRPWARNARSLRIGEIILIVDSDTVVPEVSTHVAHLLYMCSVLIYRASRTVSGMLRASWRSALMWQSSSMNQASPLFNPCFPTTCICLIRVPSCHFWICRHPFSLDNK